VLERAARDPANAREARNAASSPDHPRDPHSSGGGTPPQTDQSACAASPSGGGDQSRQSWQPSGASMSLGSPLNTPFASSSRCGSWTTPKLRSPEAADRWTWLVILAYVQLRLARPLVVDHRLPWQTPLPLEKLTPARVRRAFSQLLPTLGRLASMPQPCGRSPGRPKGRRSKTAKRFPAIKLTA
jgi:hypothetical protein